MAGAGVEVLAVIIDILTVEICLIYDIYFTVEIFTPLRI